MKKYVNTNIGLLPVEDYLDIKASEYGYDSYETLKKNGIEIPIDEIFEITDDKRGYIKIKKLNENKN